MAVTYNPTKRRDDSFPSQEEVLFDLIRGAETTAYALAHSNDLSGYPDRAYEMLVIGECLREATDHLDVLIHSVEAARLKPFGLKSRALLLRERLSGPAWVSAAAAPLVPGRSDPQRPKRKSRTRTYGRI
jgi:hypothetical protein